MKYPNIKEAKFISRPNRFVAQVEVGGREETVHVKNTGRCKELLLPGTKVWLTAPEGSGNRKTKYDLVAVEKENFGIINIDSQAPNKVMAEWLAAQDYDYIKPEYTYSESRIDFYAERGDERTLIEVKGCTLEIDGVGYFPDAPTERGVRHIKELEKAASKGFRAILAFIIQMNGVTEVRPNVETHPEFGEALAEAAVNGVEIWHIPCRVTADSCEVLY